MPEITAVVIGSGAFKPTDKEWNLGVRIDGEDSRIPGLVMEASIKRYWPEAPVINTHDMKRPYLKNGKNPTAFSLVRLWVPELCGFKGWGVYVDSDQLVFCDIREMLEDGPAKDLKADAFGNRLLKTKPAYINKASNCTGVALLNCEQLHHWDAFKFAEACGTGKADYSNGVGAASFNGLGPDRIGDLGPHWNAHEVFHEGTKLLHYTSMARQPWKFPGIHEEEKRWAEALRYAIENGFVEREWLDEKCGQILGTWS